MYDSPFTPLGPTYLVSATPVQILTVNSIPYSCMRVFNTSTAAIRIAWLQQASNPVSINTAAPTASQVAVNCVTIPGGARDALGIPMNSWVAASSAALEVTPGEGVV